MHVDKINYDLMFSLFTEYVNFWLDAIHCYSENEDYEDKSEQNFPSVIVVGTCSDKLKVLTRLTRKNMVSLFIKHSPCLLTR